MSQSNSIILNKNIKDKIRIFIEKYTNSMNEFSKEELEYNTKDFNIIEVNKYSRNLVTNYANKSQYVYNYIVSYSIMRTIEYLNKECKFFQERLQQMLQFKDKIYSDLIIDAIKSIENPIIEDNNKLYYSKIIYILFFYLGIQRQIIYVLQTRINNHYIPYKYGLLETIFTEDKIDIHHPIFMKRFENYKNRLIINIDKILNIKNDIKNDLINKSVFNSIKNANVIKTPTTNKIYYTIFFNIALKDEKIPYNLPFIFNKEIFIYCFFAIKDNEFIMKKIYGISNSSNLSARLQFLNIISYCLKILDNNLDNNSKKECIIIIYYLIIMIMPFKLGTASIAEIFLYSLWKKYIGKKLKINDNIMLDVEALTLPYELFKKNCFEIDQEENNKTIKYTPYLIEI